MKFRISNLSAYFIKAPVHSHSDIVKEVIVEMEIMLYIAAIIAAAAFVVLVVYAIVTRKEAKKTMSNVHETLNSLDKQMQGVTTEATQLLNKTKRLAEDLNQKSEKVDGLFDGAKNIGKSVKGFNQSLKQLSNSISKTASEDPEKVSQAVKWGSAIIDLWKKKKNN